MKTLMGQEAIDVAEQYGIPLFDSKQNSHITVGEARKLIQTRRDLASFILEDWPEADNEAEQVVLWRLHIAINVHNMPEATISDICNLKVGRGIHPHAAELAADRLIQQRELELVEDPSHVRRFRLRKNTYFTTSFLEGLRSQVCDECAHLNLEKPFHKTCLMALVDYLVNEDFTLSDVTNVGEDSSASGARLPNLLHGASARWLSQTMTATKGRLRSVVKPILTQTKVDDRTHLAPDAPGSSSSSMVPDLEPAGGALDPTDIWSRAQISKSQLIAYLKEVEIVDEGGELAALKSERDRLLKQLDAKEQEIQQIGRQRIRLEGQCQDMQRDLDTLLQAMQIAKRRGYNPTQVIDAEVNTK